MQEQLCLLDKGITVTGKVGEIGDATQSDVLDKWKVWAVSPEFMCFSSLKLDFQAVHSLPWLRDVNKTLVGIHKQAELKYFIQTIT